MEEVRDARTRPPHTKSSEQRGRFRESRRNANPRLTVVRVSSHWNHLEHLLPCGFARTPEIRVTISAKRRLTLGSSKSTPEPSAIYLRFPRKLDPKILAIRITEAQRFPSVTLARPTVVEARRFEEQTRRARNKRDRSEVERANEISSIPRRSVTRLRGSVGRSPVESKNKGGTQGCSQGLLREEQQVPWSARRRPTLAR